jgi:superfamily II DNA or RNA helicase
MSFDIHIDVNNSGDGVLTSSHLDVIREFFSWENEARRHAKPYAKKFMPMREYAISPEGIFNIGLLNVIYDCVKTMNPNLDASNFQVTPRAKYFYEPSFLLPPNYELFDFSEFGFKYRDIQETALKDIFRRGRGIIEVGTAGGKGLIMASICKTLSTYNPATTFAIILPTHLVDKTLREFVDEYGFTEGLGVSAWDGDNKLNPTSQVVIVGQHILNTREIEFNAYIANRSVVMVDECHIVKRTGVLNKRMQALKTNNIIGLTGSLPEKAADKLNVLGVIGKVVCSISSRDIKDKGLKADSKIISIKFDGSTFDGRDENGNTPSNATEAFALEKEYILTNEVRTKYIADWIGKACKGNTLIPVDLDYHEKIVKESLEHLGRKIYVVNGETPKAERTRIYKELENETDAIIIAKVGVMREGISINNLSFMVGYFIQKSFVRIVQLIGRIERHGGNEIPLFFDFWDTTPFSSKHYAQRLKIYKKEKIQLIEKDVLIKY